MLSRYEQHHLAEIERQLSDDRLLRKLAQRLESQRTPRHRAAARHVTRRSVLALLTGLVLAAVLTVMIATLLTGLTTLPPIADVLIPVGAVAAIAVGCWWCQRRDHGHAGG